MTFGGKFVLVPQCPVDQSKLELILLCLIFYGLNNVFCKYKKKCQKSLLASVKSERFCYAIWSCSESPGFRSIIPISVNDLTEWMMESKTFWGPIRNPMPFKTNAIFFGIQNSILMRLIHLLKSLGLSKYEWYFRIGMTPFSAG